MRIILLNIVLAGTLLSPIIAPAELIFYKGVRRDTINGDGNTFVVNGKFLMIVDHATAHVATIFYATVNGQKHYSTSLVTNTHFVQVRGSLKTYTAISRPPTECELESGATGESVYCSGADALLTLSAESSISFPKMLKDAGNGISFSRTSGAPGMNEGSFQVTFDRPGTLASNQAGESLTAASDWLVRQIESLGYVR